MKTFEMYGVYSVSEDINPEIKKGMKGTILEVLGNGDAYLMEFVKEDGTSHTYEGEFIFVVKSDQLRSLT